MGVETYSKFVAVVSLICTHISGGSVYDRKETSPSQDSFFPTTIPYTEIHKNNSGNSNDAFHRCSCGQYVINCSDAMCSSTNNSKQEGFTSPFDNIYEMKVYMFIVNYSMYLSDIPGFVTNTMTIVLVYKMKSFKSTELYIVCLSISDLLIVLLRFTYYYLDGLKIEWTYNLCRMFDYWKSSLLVFSNYIVACWTVERMCAVLFPFKFSVWFTQKRVKCCLGILLCWSLLWTIPYLTDTLVIRIQSGNATRPVCDYSVFFYEVWHFIEIMYYVLLPLVVVLICNIAIIFRVAKQTKERLNITSNKNVIDKKRLEQTKLTIILIATSTTFVVLHIPYCVALVWYSLYPDPTVILANSPRDFVNYYIYTNLAMVITDIQNWINFFVYILTGKKFRTALRHMFCPFQNPVKTSRDIDLSSRTHTTAIVTA